MSRRFLLTLAMMFSLALTSLQAQDKEKAGSINDKVMRQVEKALQKFEGDLEKGKIESIMKSVERTLDGKSIRFEWSEDLPGGALNAENLPQHLKTLRAKVGDVDGELSELMPRLIELSQAQVTENSDRKVVGIVLESTDGKVSVQKVMDKSPAEKAGVMSGDVIIKVDGKKIEDPKALIEVVKESGKDLNFAVKRDGKLIEIKVVPETASKVPGFNRSIIRMSKDGVPIEIGNLEGLIELQGKGLDGLYEELIESANGNIFKFAPGEKGAKMESLFKKLSEPDAEKNVDRESGNRKVVDEEIEIKTERSETAKTIDRLQKQLENLEKEISKLKKDF